MKRTIILILYLFVPFLIVEGQNNYVIFSDDLIYHERIGGLGGYAHYYYFFKNNEDTLINSKYYKKLYRYGVNNLGDTINDCCIFIREEITDKKIYLYDNYYNNQEILLYDFNLKNFDSLLIRNGHYVDDSLYYFIYKIDSLEFNNIFYKRFWLKTNPMGYDSFRYYLLWAEKIGNIEEGGLFHYYNNYSPVSEAQSYTISIFHYDTVIFCQYDSCTTPPDSVLNFISNHITGYVYEDKNQNCLMEPGEPGLPNKTIEIQPGDYFAKTDSFGFFRIGVGKDSFMVSLQDTNSLWFNRCHNDSSSYQVAFNSYRNNSVPLYFGIDSLTVSAEEKKLFQESIVLFPNPSTGKINVLSKTLFPQKLSIEIVNLLGIKVISYSGFSATNKTHLDVTALYNGIYFCVAKTMEGNCFRYKFILNKGL